MRNLAIVIGVLFTLGVLCAGVLSVLGIGTIGVGGAYYLGGHDVDVDSIALVKPTHPTEIVSPLPFPEPPAPEFTDFQPVNWTQCGQNWSVSQPGVYAMPDGSQVEIAPASF